MSVLSERPSRSPGLEHALQESRDEQTAAYFHISISRKKGSKIRVEVDAELDEEAVGRLIDLDKVRLMREQRQKQQDEWEAVPYDDRYKVKSRKVVDGKDEEKVKNKVLTKKAERRESKKSLTDAGGGKKEQQKIRIDRLAKSNKSESALQTMKELEEQKKKLPFFAQPFLKLRDARKDDDWTRPAPPRYHGLHIHTKCFQKKEKVPQWCEKVPVFQKYLTEAEALNGGPLAKHVQRRTQIYDGLCQELMGLEEKQTKKPRVYSPLKTNCYDCQRYANAAEGVFFKSSYQDQNRNAIRSHKPSLALQRKFY